MNRRQFLEIVGAGLAASFLPTSITEASRIAPATEDQLGKLESSRYPTVPEWLQLDLLEPNKAANLSNLVVVPERLYQRTNKEMVKMAVDFRQTFNPNNPSELQSDIWGYGESVRDALKRGQTAWLIFDLPDDYLASIDDLSIYFAALARRFTITDSSGNLRSARFVIGNELNANSQTRTQKYLEWYATVYVAAAKQMRVATPELQLFPFGEAYYGNGSTLMAALDEIQAASGGHLSSLVSGLCFRFYDDLSKIAERSRIYAQVAREYSLDPEQLHLMELSKSEKTATDYSIHDHQQTIVRNLATALALKQMGTIQTCFWHTAENIADPNGHALFEHEGNYFAPKPQYFTFELVSKLLYKIYHYAEVPNGSGQSLVEIKSKTSKGDDVTLTWFRFYNGSGKLIRETEPELTIARASDALSRRDIAYKLWLQYIQ